MPMGLAMRIAERMSEQWNYNPDDYTEGQKGADNHRRYDIRSTAEQLAAEEPYNFGYGDHIMVMRETVKFFCSHPESLIGFQRLFEQLDADQDDYPDWQRLKDIKPMIERAFEEAKRDFTK